MGRESRKIDVTSGMASPSSSYIHREIKLAKPIFRDLYYGENFREKYSQIDIPFEMHVR